MHSRKAVLELSILWVIDLWFTLFLIVSSTKLRFMNMFRLEVGTKSFP